MTSAVEKGTIKSQEGDLGIEGAGTESSSASSGWVSLRWCYLSRNFKEVGKLAKQISDRRVFLEEGTASA